MAGKRFWIRDCGGLNVVPTIKYQTDAGDGVMEVGMLLKFKTNGSPYAIPEVDGDHTIGTDTAIIGLVAKDSTHTATADGVVEVYLPLPGIVYEGYATTAANVDTQAEIDALCGDRVTIDVSAVTSAGNWTVDEDAGESQTNAFQIVGGDPEKKTIYFITRIRAFTTQSSGM
jgi:hypothetical protein